MKYLFVSILLVCISFSSAAQLNLNLLGQLDLNSLHNQGLNDIWGYTDELGNEYALVGGTKGTSVVDISDPANPVEIFFEPGMESVWRDIKTVGDYAYVTTEALNGLLIIDLSPLPGSAALTTSYYTGPVGQEWQSAHNLYADDNGYAYIFGSNRGNGGAIILDVVTDPMNPIEVGEFDTWYVHDGYAANDTLYLGHISDGFFSMVNIADPANPVLLGTHATPSTFTHNIWTMGNNYAFTTDEVSGGYIGAYDISDPANIIELDRVQSSPGSGVIPHNTHVLNNYVITSYYSDGVTVHDATYPYNLIEVGNYDTYPLQTTSYDGCWGVYPFFSSGTMVASDRTQGLFVLSPTYIQAAYLEGDITNSVTTLPLDGVTVQLTGATPEMTGSNGFYATGMAAAGSYDVTYSKIGYYPQTVNVSLANGVVTQQDIALIPIPPFNLDIIVLEQGTNLPIENVEIRLQGITATHEGLTNALGEETMTLFYEESYRMAFGKWGYVTYCDVQVLDAQTATMTIYLDKGYYDDFTFDFGWAVTGTATSGMFERAIPLGSASSPYVDSDDDCFDYCYITENLSTGSITDGDVDNGFVMVRSPVMDLSTYNDPFVHYDRWFYCDLGPLPPGDSLEIYIGDGVTSYQIDVQNYDPTTYGFWIEKNIRILDFTSNLSTIQLFVMTSDYPSDFNATEAAFDDFFIVEADLVSLPKPTNEAWTLFPNPSNGEIHVKNLEVASVYEVRSYSGKLVDQGIVEINGSLNGSDWAAGVYFVKIDDTVQKIVIAK